MSTEEYKKIYMEGYTAGLRDGKAEAQKEEKPFFDNDDIRNRYGVGKAKASEIIRAVRHVCGGGGFGASGMVKRSELLYWESIVDTTFIEKLAATAAK